MASTVHSADELSLTEARRIVKDLFAPKPWIYWTDFGLSLVIGHLLYFVIVFAPWWLPDSPVAAWAVRLVAFPVCCFLYYRAALFIHELTHLPRDQFRLFRIVWNWFCGCVFLMPSFVYYTHVDHHRRKHYGTEQDGEYLPLGHLPKWHMLLYLGQSFIIPLLALVRFFLLTPLTWIIPGFRDLIHKHASSMIMDPTYVRPLPTAATLRIIRLQEVVCFLWCVTVAILLCTVLQPYALTMIAVGYLLGVSIIFVNAVRTLGSHQWRNRSGEISFVSQLLDSVNYPDRPYITELWGPVGLRFHALHHLFPSLPYHAMGEAHRRLMEQLPADSPYRRTVRTSLLEVVFEIWKREIPQSEPGHPAATA